MKETYTSYDEFPALLGANELGRILPLSRAGIYNLMNNQSFPTIRIGKRMLVSKEALINWLEAQENKQAV